jgi:hypothetical protein
VVLGLILVAHECTKKTTTKFVFDMHVIDIVADMYIESSKAAFKDLRVFPILKI